jgi:hypothetical protein
LRQATFRLLLVCRDFGPVRPGERLGYTTSWPHAGALSASPLYSRGWWAWCGLHGGAGLTTLREAVPGGVDFLGHPAVRVWLTQSGDDTSAAERDGARDHLPDLPVVGVCRSHMSGLEAAQRWAAWKTVHQLPVLGLVVVVDAPGRLPRPLESMMRLVSGGYPRLWRMPWVKEWRLGERPSPDNTPPVYRRLQQELYELAGVPGDLQGVQAEGM